MIMHGAYNPMPIVISAPKRKLTATPIHRRKPLEAERLPDSAELTSASGCSTMKSAAAARQRDPHTDLNVTPRQTRHEIPPEPSAGNCSKDQQNERRGWTATMPMKIAPRPRWERMANVERSGYFFVGNEPQKLEERVVVANEPMPSVSKKFVTKPIATARCRPERRWRDHVRTRPRRIPAESPRDRAPTIVRIVIVSLRPQISTASGGRDRLSRDCAGLSERVTAQFFATTGCQVAKRGAFDFAQDRLRMDADRRTSSKCPRARRIAPKMRD